MYSDSAARSVQIIIGHFFTVMIDRMIENCLIQKVFLPGSLILHGPQLYSSSNVNFLLFFAFHRPARSLAPLKMNKSGMEVS